MEPSCTDLILTEKYGLSKLNVLKKKLSDFHTMAVYAPKMYFRMAPPKTANLIHLIIKVLCFPHNLLLNHKCNVGNTHMFCQICQNGLNTQ